MLVACLPTEPALGLTFAPDPAARSPGDPGHAAQSPLEAPVTPNAAPPRRPRRSPDARRLPAHRSQPPG